MAKTMYSKKSIRLLVVVVVLACVTSCYGALAEDRDQVASLGLKRNLTYTLASSNKTNDDEAHHQNRQTQKTNETTEQLESSPTITSVHQVWTSSSSGRLDELSPEIISKLRNDVPFLAAYALRPRLVGAAAAADASSSGAAAAAASPILQDETVASSYALQPRAQATSGDNDAHLEAAASRSSSISSTDPRLALASEISARQLDARSTSAESLVPKLGDFSEFNVETASLSKSEHHHRRKTSLKRQPKRAETNLDDEAPEFSSSSLRRRQVSRSGNKIDSLGQLVKGLRKQQQHQQRRRQVTTAGKAVRSKDKSKSKSKRKASSGSKRRSKKSAERRKSKSSRRASSSRVISKRAQLRKSRLLLETEESPLSGVKGGSGSGTRNKPPFYATKSSGSGGGAQSPSSRTPSSSGTDDQRSGASGEGSVNDSSKGDTDDKSAEDEATIDEEPRQDEPRRVGDADVDEEEGDTVLVEPKFDGVDDDPPLPDEPLPENDGDNDDDDEPEENNQKGGEDGDVPNAIDERRTTSGDKDGATADGNAPRLAPEGDPRGNRVNRQKPNEPPRDTTDTNEQDSSEPSSGGSGGSGGQAAGGGIGATIGGGGGAGGAGGTGNSGDRSGDRDDADDSATPKDGNVAVPGVEFADDERTPSTRMKGRDDDGGNEDGDQDRSLDRDGNSASGGSSGAVDGATDRSSSGGGGGGGGEFGDRRRAQDGAGGGGGKGTGNTNRGNDGDDDDDADADLDYRDEMAEAERTAKSPKKDSGGSKQPPQASTGGVGSGNDESSGKGGGVTSGQDDDDDDQHQRKSDGRAAPKAAHDKHGDQHCDDGSYDHHHDHHSAGGHHDHHDTIDWLRGAIPGEPDDDYPILSRVNATNFKCSSQKHPGYYADVESRCQIFHICQADGRQDSFLCPNGTIFSQRTLVCVWWNGFNCEDAPKYYHLNELLYKTTEGNESPQAAAALPAGSTLRPLDGMMRPKSVRSRGDAPSALAPNDADDGGDASPIDGLVRTMRGREDARGGAAGAGGPNAIEKQGGRSTNFRPDEDEATIQRKSTNFEDDADEDPARLRAKSNGMPRRRRMASARQAPPKLTSRRVSRNSRRRKLRHGIKPRRRA